MFKDLFVTVRNHGPRSEEVKKLRVQEEMTRSAEKEFLEKHKRTRKPGRAVYQQMRPQRHGVGPRIEEKEGQAEIKKFETTKDDSDMDTNVVENKVKGIITSPMKSVEDVNIVFVVGQDFIAPVMLRHSFR